MKEIVTKHIRDYIEDSYKRNLYTLYLDNAKDISFMDSKYFHFYEIMDNSIELKEILDFYEYRYFSNREDKKISDDINVFCKDYIVRNNSYGYIGYEFTSWEIKNTISNLKNRNSIPDLIFGSSYYKISNIKDFIKKLCLGLCNESKSLAVEERGFITNVGKSLLYSEYLRTLSNSDLNEYEYAFITCENTRDFRYEKSLDFFASNLSIYDLNSLIERHILSYL
jgi:hypothetical protein